MPAAKTDDAGPKAVKYVATYPYAARTIRKGRRRVDHELLKGRHYGEMPVFGKSEARPVFSVSAPETGSPEPEPEIEATIYACGGHAYAVLYDAGGGTYSVDRFQKLLDGELTGFRAGMNARYNPFCTATAWADVKRFGHLKHGVHVARYAEAPADTAAKGAGSNEADAAARAARIAGKMALIWTGETYSVAQRIPAPMWRVAKRCLFEDMEGFKSDDAFDVVVVPEWRLTPIAQDYYVPDEVAPIDSRIKRMQATGQLFSWDRLAEAEQMAAFVSDGMKNRPGVRRVGGIRVLDEALALEVSRPGADLAASAVDMLWPLWHATGLVANIVPDGGIVAWMRLRSRMDFLENARENDLATAMEAFAAAEDMLQHVEALAMDGVKSMAMAMTLARPVMARWNAEKASMAVRREPLSAEDEEAVSAMGI